jgi:hypothetical protein
MQRNPSSRRPPVHQRPLPPVRKVVRPQQRKPGAKAVRRLNLPR